MTTEGSPGPGPEQQAAVQGTLARISALHKAPNLEVEELLGQFEQLDLLGVTNHPAIAAALRAEGQIPEVADRVRSDLETERFQRLGVLLGVEKPPVVVPEAEDGEMAGLRQEAEELTGQAVQRGLTPRQAFDRFVPEPEAPAEDLSMLSLSQLKERAASLTSEQLSQIPPYKLYSIIDNELLTVEQVVGLPEDPRAKAIINQLVQSNLNFDEMYNLLRKKEGSLEPDIKDLPKMVLEAARETFRAAMQVNPLRSSQKTAFYTLEWWLESLERQWQKYLKSTSRLVVGGLARITARKPALNQEEISRLKNLTTMAGAARLVYSEETHSEWLSEEEDYLAGTGSLREATIKWNMPDLENNLAKDPDTFPLLARYVRELREAGREPLSELGRTEEAFKAKLGVTGEDMADAAETLEDQHEKRPREILQEQLVEIEKLLRAANINLPLAPGDTNWLAVYAGDDVAKKPGAANMLLLFPGTMLAAQVTPDDSLWENFRNIFSPEDVARIEFAVFCRMKDQPPSQEWQAFFDNAISGLKQDKEETAFQRFEPRIAALLDQENRELYTRLLELRARNRDGDRFLQNKKLRRLDQEATKADLAYEKAIRQTKPIPDLAAIFRNKTQRAIEYYELLDSL